VFSTNNTVCFLVFESWLEGEARGEVWTFYFACRFPTIGKRFSVNSSCNILTNEDLKSLFLSSWQHSFLAFLWEGGGSDEPCSRTLFLATVTKFRRLLVLSSTALEKYSECRYPWPFFISVYHYARVCVCICVCVHVCVYMYLLCRSLQSVHCESLSLRACKIVHVHSVGISGVVSVSGRKRGEVSNHAISNRTAMRVLYRYYCRSSADYKFRNIRCYAVIHDNA